jgi:hypothetical protein
MHSWNTFGARMNCKQTWIHKTHHSPNLGEATTFPLIVFFMHGHGAYIQMSVFPRTPKLGISQILEIKIFATLETHNFLWRPSIKVRFKEKL